MRKEIMILQHHLKESDILGLLVIHTLYCFHRYRVRFVGLFLHSSPSKWNWGIKLLLEQFCPQAHCPEHQYDWEHIWNICLEEDDSEWRVIWIFRLMRCLKVLLDAVMKESRYRSNFIEEWKFLQNWKLGKDIET